MSEDAARRAYGIAELLALALENPQRRRSAEPAARRSTSRRGCDIPAPVFATQAEAPIGCGSTIARVRPESASPPDIFRINLTIGMNPVSGYLLYCNSGMAEGSHQRSRIRPNRLFTADSGIVVYRAGQISQQKMDEDAEHLIAIIKQPLNGLRASCALHRNRLLT